MSKLGSKYQLVNRRTGKCMALASDSDSAQLTQKTCSTGDTQLFTFYATGDGAVHLIFAGGKTTPTGSDLNPSSLSR